MPSSLFSKPMRIMLISVSLILGSLLCYKLLIRWMIQRAMHNHVPIISVSASQIYRSEWQPSIEALGSLRAVNGVNMTTELSGLVESIYFKPGTFVKKGTPLLQLNAESEGYQLQAIQANAKLAQITYQRDRVQYAIHAISQQALDTDQQNLKNLTGQVAQKQAIIAKKTLRAPFSGWVGINKVNLGQYLQAGTPVTMLQSLNPIYVDFYVPQQEYSQLHLGQPVIMSSDSFANQQFTGTLTTINPGVDPSTRNVEAEATISNPSHILIPGMFVHVTIQTGAVQQYLTVPQTAITFNPYGNIVFILHENPLAQTHSSPTFTAQQSFVSTGPTRGDQIAVLEGIKEGDRIVTSGQLKLANGSQVIINNMTEPHDDPQPELPNDH